MKDTELQNNADKIKRLINVFGTGPHFGIDVDGVLRDFVSSLQAKMQMLHPDIEIKHASELRTFHIKYLSDDPDVQKLIMDVGFNDPQTSYDVFFDAEPYEPDLSDYRTLYHLMKLVGGTVSICSSQTTHHQRRATADWLSKHEVPFDNLVLASSPKYVFDFDFLVDDHIDNCLGLVDNRPHAISVLKKLPHSIPRRHLVESRDSIFTIDNTSDLVRVFAVVVKDLEDLGERFAMPQHTPIVLSDEDRDTFLDLLEEDEPTEALKDAAKAAKNLINND